MTKVKVVGDVNNNIIAPSLKNPEYGYIRVEQEALQIGNHGWLKASKRSAFIKGKVSDLKKLNYVAGQELPGKIVIKESLEPPFLENPHKNLKMAGNSGIICRIDDQPIYRESFYTTNLNDFDEFLSHNNSDEIKDAQIAVKELLMVNSPKETEVTL